MITMRGISRESAEALNTDVEFIALCQSEISAEFNYYVNVDLATVNEVPLPYFSIVTYNDEDDKEIKKAFRGFYKKEGKEIDKVVLTGGMSFLPGLKDYFSSQYKSDRLVAVKQRILFL